MKVKAGYTRRVFLLGDYAIKIPHTASLKRFAYGILSNIHETYNYDPDKPMAPIHYGCGLVVIMSRVKPIEGEFYIPEQMDELVGHDSKASSFGILDKSIVAIDYHRSIYK